MKEVEITPDIKRQLMQQFAPKVYPVKSDDPNKEYIISLTCNHITCTCRSWQFRSKDKDGYMRDPPFYCKHQKRLAYTLLNKVHQNV